MSGSIMQTSGSVAEPCMADNDAFSEVQASAKQLIGSLERELRGLSSAGNPETDQAVRELHELLDGIRSLLS